MSRTNSKTKLASRQTKGRGKQTNELEQQQQGSKKVEVPQLAWKILSESVMHDLKGTTDVDKVARKLANILSLAKSEVDLREAAELDYFVAGFWCACNEWQLTNEQVSAFVSLLHAVLHNLKEKELSLCENIKELQTLMSNVGVPDTPTSLECFTTEVASMTLQYIQTSLFQHYSLFQYLYTEEQETEMHTAQIDVEIPNPEPCVFPSPLEESLPYELYIKCKPFHPKTDEIVKEQEEVEPEESKDTVEDVDVVTLPSMDEEEMKVSSKEVKTLMEDLAKTTLEPFQTLMNQKIKEKEDTMTSRLSKLEKVLNVQDKQ